MHPAVPYNPLDAGTVETGPELTLMLLNCLFIPKPMRWLRVEKKMFKVGLQVVLHDMVTSAVNNKELQPYAGH